MVTSTPVPEKKYSINSNILALEEIMVVNESRTDDRNYMEEANSTEQLIIWRSADLLKQLHSSKLRRGSNLLVIMSNFTLFSIPFLVSLLIMMTDETSDLI